LNYSAPVSTKAAKADATSSIATTIVVSQSKRLLQIARVNT
jgi:hypothetical protein